MTFSLQLVTAARWWVGSGNSILRRSGNDTCIVDGADDIVIESFF